MTGLFETVAWNSLAAVVLALFVLVAGRVWQRPELLHVLWLVVLIKLVTPAVVRLDTVPVLDAIQFPIASPAPVDMLSASSAFSAPLATVPTMNPLRLTDGLAALWIGGSLALLIFVGFQCARFARVMRAATPAGPALRRRIDVLAQRLGVEAPVARVLNARVPPLVWSVFGRGTLVLPAELLARLETEETDTLLAHELAHLKRRDPWIRWIELAVTASLWWNPLVWWVRRKIRRAEELACDRWVLDLLPGSQRAYADGIVKTVEFLAGHPRPPALATGAAGTRYIKERLTMILKPAPNRRLRHPLVPALLLALLALPIVPGFADRDDEDIARAQAEMIELEREALELERRLNAIQVEQLELERRLGEARSDRESAEMLHHAEQLRRDGLRAEAAQIEAEIERRERDGVAERAFEQQMMEREREMRDTELQMREARIELERARRAQDGSAVESYERAAAEYERALAAQAGDHEVARRAYERAMELRARSEEFHYRHQADELASIDEEVRAQLKALKLVYEHTDDAERLELQREIEELTKRLRELEMLRKESGAR